MTAGAAAASRLALASALAGLALGGAALWLGVAAGAVALWGFGGASLLQVPPALSLRGRIRDGLGNTGLERERLTLRSVSYLSQALALGMAMASASALLGGRAPQPGPVTPGLALVAVILLAGAWSAKRGLCGLHPTLDLDAARTRAWLELAVLLLAGSLLERWFPWADAVTGLALALRLFLAGRALTRASTLQAAACGGCGSGCGCG